jgi:hypothetical protein
LLAACTTGFLIGAATLAQAQPWVSSAGHGSVTVAAQRIDHTGHRVSDGTLFDNGRSLNVSLYVGIEYALTDRWTLSTALPYVFGKYTDPLPPPPFIPFLPIDQCRCWHSGPQDIDLTARYNVVNGRFALTPSVSFGLPSHDYAYQGEATLGRHLKELRLAIAAGRQLGAITPRLSIDGQYAYAIVERVLDIPNNRSNARAGASYRFTDRLSAGGVVTWQRTHGGLRLGAPAPFPLVPPGEVNTAERLSEHDRLLRDNSVHVGGNVAYQFPHFDLFGSYLAFVDGTDTHAGRAMTVGVSVPFAVVP